MSDHLADALAAEEHRQGMAYGQEREHCGTCALVARSHLQSRCEHESASTVELATLGQPRQELLRTCRECGLSWREEGEWG